MRRVTDLVWYQHIVMLSAAYRYCLSFTLVGMIVTFWYFLSYKPLHLLYKTALEQHKAVQEQCQSYTVLEAKLKSAQQALDLKKQSLQQADVTSIVLFFFEKAHEYLLTIDQLVVKTSSSKKQWVEGSMYGSYTKIVEFLNHGFGGQNFYIKNIALHAYQTDSVKVSFTAVIPNVAL